LYDEKMLDRLGRDIAHNARIEGQVVATMEFLDEALMPPMPPKGCYTAGMTPGLFESRLQEFAEKHGLTYTLDHGLMPRIVFRPKAVA